MTLAILRGMGLLKKSFRFCWMDRGRNQRESMISYASARVTPSERGLNPLRVRFRTSSREKLSQSMRACALTMGEEATADGENLRNSAIVRLLRSDSNLSSLSVVHKPIAMVVGMWAGTETAGVTSYAIVFLMCFPSMSVLRVYVVPSGNVLGVRVARLRHCLANRS